MKSKPWRHPLGLAAISLVLAYAIFEWGIECRSGGSGRSHLHRWF